MNPYDPRRDPREATFDGRPVLATGGSSSGIGTAASFWAANVGTETSGSILSPANQNMLAAIKPTVGRVSRYGVIPITADQDTPGPMARTVTDAAIMLGALEGAAPDPNDAATKTCTPPPGRDYTRFLNPKGLKGARIGIPRAFFYDKATPPGAKEPRGGLNDEQAKVMAEAIAVLKQQGAVIVDPADIPSVVDDGRRRTTSCSWNVCSGLDNAKGKDADCSVVFKYGMKRDFNAWLTSLGAEGAGEDADRAAAVEHRAPEGGRDQVRPGAARHLRRDGRAGGPRALRGRPREGHPALGHGGHRRGHEGSTSSTPCCFPAASGATIAAKPGYPTVMVPFGFVPNAPSAAAAPPPAFPAGFDPKPSPFGVSFTGMACSEPRLIELAYAFEQATKRRVPPASAP